MENRIDILEPTILLGKSREMSLAEDKTQELWQSFGPLVKTIKGRKDRNFISMQKYTEPFNPSRFNPLSGFSKWAAVAMREGVNMEELEARSPDLQHYRIDGGLYAVFKHVGPASEFGRSMEFIYGKWFPNNPYQLDHREHFEILPEGYRPDDPEAEEEIWIPIKKNTSDRKNSTFSF